jgi:hypothetical protein
MTPFEVTALSVTLNAAGIAPSANNLLPPPNVIGNIFSPERIDQIMLDEEMGCSHKWGSHEWRNPPSCGNEVSVRHETKLRAKSYFGTAQLEPKSKWNERVFIPK